MLKSINSLSWELSDQPTQTACVNALRILPTEAELEDMKVPRSSNQRRRDSSDCRWWSWGEVARKNCCSHITCITPCLGSSSIRCTLHAETWHQYMAINKCMVHLASIQINVRMATPDTNTGQQGTLRMMTPGINTGQQGALCMLTSGIYTGQ